MSLLIQRLDRETARTLIAAAREASTEKIAAAMPNRDTVVTYSPVGGARITNEALESLRREVVGLAREHGYPGSVEAMQAFEGRLSRLLYHALPMTPNEASHEEVWSYLTCCWLLDVAVWRFGREADERRFLGHVNRNTFRRLWWRVEVLGDIPLDRLGEDELVNIMERPTIAGDRRIAQAIAAEFLQRLADGDAIDRMLLMRESMKRVLRLTPFVSFASLNDAELRAVVVASFDASAAGLAGLPVPPLAPMPTRMPAPSPLVSRVNVDVAVAVNGAAAASQPSTRPDDVRLAGEVAIDIARKTGRVTNMMLREVLPISADEARDVFQHLISSGKLQRRGVKRGTHYVLPQTHERERSTQVSEPYLPPPASQPPRRETALRRLLRRER